MVDIGVELFAVTASCAYARHLAADKGQASAVELADFYAKLARAKVQRHFRGLWHNEDKAGYALSRSLIDGRYAWIEKGVMPVEEFTEGGSQLV